MFSSKIKRLEKGLAPLKIARARNVKSFTGFTLVELMVVLVIIIALAILVLAGYSESFSRLAVERTTESFIGDLYRTRGSSFGSLAHEDSGEIVKYSQGIFLKENSAEYTIFLDKSGNREYSEGEDGVVRVINTERGAIISHIEIEGDPKGELSILFCFEEREAFFNGGRDLSAEITFQARGDEELKRGVHINSLGVAEIIYE